MWRNDCKVCFSSQSDSSGNESELLAVVPHRERPPDRSSVQPVWCSIPSAAERFQHVHSRSGQLRSVRSRHGSVECRARLGGLGWAQRDGGGHGPGTVHAELLRPGNDSPTLPKHRLGLHCNRAHYVSAQSDITTHINTFAIILSDFNRIS